MSNEHMTEIEVNGVKMEVDLRYAKRVETIRVGSKVKVLSKKDNYNSNAVFPGVVVGFEPFQDLPTIIVCYLKVDYSGAELKFAYINSDSKDKWDIVLSVDDELPVEKNEVLAKIDGEIERKQSEVEDLQRKRDYFLSHFNRYFEAVAT